MTSGLCTRTTTSTPTFWSGSRADRAARASHSRYPRTPMTLKAAMTAVAAAAVGLGLAACGGSSKAGGVMLAPSAGPTSTTITKTPSTTSTATTTTAAAVPTPSSGPLSKEPKIKLPTGPAPTKLKVIDLIKGTGATAVDGDTLHVNYVGELYKGGKVFDASWKDTPGQTYS